jgi:flagellar biogenesis protein FliO
MLLRLWADRRVTKAEREREMELVEMLSLGGRRQLMLIRCAGERFLVGGSLDRIETMVKLESKDPEFARKGSTCE